MNPAARLAAFVLFALYVPLLPVRALGVLFAALLLALAARGLTQAYAKLVWRTRFVLLALGIAYLLGGAFDQGGLLAWLRSALYLLALLAALQLMVLSLPRPQLLVGLVTLLRPLAALGIPTHAFCVRMLLTLEYVAALRGQPWRDLLGQVLRADAGADLGEETLTLPALPWRRRDTAIVVALGALCAGLSFVLAR